MTPMSRCDSISSWPMPVFAAVVRPMSSYRLVW